MVIDTSAIAAILLKEPEQAEFTTRIEADSRCLISAATVLEASILLEGRKDVPIYYGLDQFLERTKCVIMPVTAEHVTVARNAFRLYGKGRHPARLNFGDCFSYALAKVSGEPLLFKGDDFRQTDIPPAAPL